MMHGYPVKYTRAEFEALQARLAQLETDLATWRQIGTSHAARIEGLKAALGLAIDGHQIWESIYGSSPTTRTHLASLQAALKGAIAQNRDDHG